MACDITFPEPQWGAVSTEARALVVKMMKKNPHERPTAADALKHEWFKDERTPTLHLSCALEKMNKYKSKVNENRLALEKKSSALKPVIVDKARAVISKKDNFDGSYKATTPLVRFKHES